MLLRGRHRVTPPQLAALIRMQRDAFMKVTDRPASSHVSIDSEPWPVVCGVVHRWQARWPWCMRWWSG